MILPADIRKALGVREGDRVMLECGGERIEMTTARLLRARAQIRIRAQFPDAAVVVDEFLAERRAEAQCGSDVDDAKTGPDA